MVASLALAQAALAQMAKILKSITGRQEAAPFVEPVDWRGLGLVDYPTVVKTPMDLGTVSRKLEAGEYRCASECAADINLVWENCKKYNQAGSDFHKLASGLQKRFEGKFAKVANKDVTIPSAGSERKLPSLQEKTALCHNLYRISREDLGKVVVKLDQICSEAIERTGEEEIEFNIDAMSGAVFSEVAKLVNGMLPESKKRRKNGSGPSNGMPKINKKAKTSTGSAVSTSATPTA